MSLFEGRVDSMTGVVVFLQSGEVPMMRHPKFIEGKTVEEIVAALQLPSEKTLALKTPYYIEPLSGQAVPSRMCAELSKSMPTGLKNQWEYALIIIPQSESEIFSLVVNVETTNNVVVPQFSVEFNTNDFAEMKGSFIFDEIVKQLALEVTDVEIKIGKKQLDKKMKASDVILKARTHQTHIKCTLAESALFTVRMRENTLKELFSTESTYIAGLNVLYNYFAPEMKKMKLVDEAQLQLLFGDLEKIIKCHIEFLNDLVGAGYLYSSQLAETFLSFAIHFMATQPYIVNYPKMVAIAGALKTDKKMEEIVANVPDSTGVDFGGYLILPIQRMPRYILLLRELIKFTPLSHPDAVGLNVAQAKLEAVTHEMEDAGDIIQGRKRVKEIESHLAKPVSLVTEDRREVATYMVMVRAPERSRGSIYLFNDILLVTSGLTGSEKIEVLRPLESVQFVPAVSDRIVSFKRESGRWIHAEFQSSQIRDEWLKKFQETRQPHLEKCPESALMCLEINTGMLMPAIEEHSFVTLGDKILYSGGRYHKSKTKLCPLITVNPETLLVEIDKTCVAEHYGSRLAECQNTVYMFGGYTNKPTAKLYKLDSNKWIQLGQKKNAFARYCHTFLSYDGRLYAFGGVNFNEELVNTIICFDPSNNNWSIVRPVSPAPPPRKHHTAVVYKDMMLIYGGENKLSVLSDFWVYNFKTNDWKCVNLPGTPPRSCHSAVIVNKFMLILGGKTGSKTSAAMPFAIDLDTWKYRELEVFGNFVGGIGKAVASFIPSRSMVIFYGGVDTFDDTPVNGVFGLHLIEEFTDQRSKPSDNPAPIPEISQTGLDLNAAKRMFSSSDKFFLSPPPVSSSDPSLAQGDARSDSQRSRTIRTRQSADDSSTLSFQERRMLFQRAVEQSQIVPTPEGFLESTGFVKKLSPRPSPLAEKAQEPEKAEEPEKAPETEKGKEIKGRKRTPSEFERSRQQFQIDMTKNNPQPPPVHDPAPPPPKETIESPEDLLSSFERAKRRFQAAIAETLQAPQRQDQAGRPNQK